MTQNYAHYLFHFVVNVYIYIYIYVQIKQICKLLGPVWVRHIHYYC